MRVKAWWKSFTLWFNSLGGVLAIVGVAADNIALLDGALPPSFYKWLAFGLIAGNGLLRFRTRQAIGTGG
jgi:hypothetical protein